MITLTTDSLARARAEVQSLLDVLHDDQMIATLLAQGLAPGAPGQASLAISSEVVRGELTIWIRDEQNHT